MRAILVCIMPIFWRFPMIAFCRLSYSNRKRSVGTFAKDLNQSLTIRPDALHAVQAYVPVAPHFRQVEFLRLPLHILQVTTTCPLPLHALQRILPEPEHNEWGPYCSENQPFFTKTLPVPEHATHVMVPELQFLHVTLTWPEAPQVPHKQSWQSNLPFPWQEGHELNLDILSLQWFTRPRGACPALGNETCSTRKTVTIFWHGRHSAGPDKREPSVLSTSRIHLSPMSLHRYTSRCKRLSTAVSRAAFHGQTGPPATRTDVYRAVRPPIAGSKLD